MSPDVATYVYCLLRAPTPPGLEGAPAGLVGAGPPRTLALGEDRWLVVADAPLSRYSSEEIERGLRDLEWVGARALEHEALVEHLLEAGTVLPMKLFSLFHGDERAVADLRGREAVVGPLLDALEGKREWGVRVIVDPGLAAGAALAQPPAEEASASAGTAFLLGKKRALDAGRVLRDELVGRAQEVYDDLERRASDARSRPPLRGEGRLLLDAAFLVSDEAAPAFHAAVGEHSKALGAAGLELALTGPWPAYNFIEPAP